MGRPASPKLTPLETRIARELDDSLAAGYTSRQIAESTGIHESALSRYRAGYTKLSLDNAGRLCEFLGLIVGRPQKKTRK